MAGARAATAALAFRNRLRSIAFPSPFMVPAVTRPFILVTDRCGRVNDHGDDDRVARFADAGLCCKRIGARAFDEGRPSRRADVLRARRLVYVWLTERRPAPVRKGNFTRP